jgi:DNA-binding response OmpR family regulator
MLKIIIIEDDRDLRGLLQKALRHAGYRVECAEDGLKGLEAHRAAPADLIVLDLMLPHLDGFGVLKELRPRDEVPVVMLTAMGQEASRILGFEHGADDYLVKPFSTLELLARIRAIFKRTQRYKEPQDIVTGPFRIDLTRRLVVRNGAPVAITSSEFNVLEVLLQHPGHPITRNEILRLAWSANNRPSPRTVDVHLVNLRRKLTLPDDPTWILTSGRLGYSWSESLLPA